MSQNTKTVKAIEPVKTVKVVKTVRVVKSPRVKKQIISLRKHQHEAVKCIDKALETNKSCLVKMTCGSGKTMIVWYKMIYGKANLSVVVCPSILLISQLNADYIKNKKWSDLAAGYSYMSICSKDEIGDVNINYTTEPKQIRKFLNKKERKIVLVTYQSLSTLIDTIKNTSIVIDLMVYDEAHHILGNQIQNIVFNKKSADHDYEFFENKWKKAIFLTATPKNSKEVTMLERVCDDIDFEDIDEDDESDESTELNGSDESDVSDESEESTESDESTESKYRNYKTDCGVLAFEYTHYQAVQDGICNDFDIAIDFSSSKEYAFQSVYSAIARCVFSTHNTKCLTFHARSEAEHDTKTNVIDFTSDTNRAKFKAEYESVLKTEFPDQMKRYSNKLIFQGITAYTKNRKALLDDYDKDKSHVRVLASCYTIGEGQDTNSSNICCFVDPRTSHSIIIQNIGRVCRKQERNSTILIPCYVDEHKYMTCNTDLERDAVIRDEMKKDNGDYVSILNVLSALRQSDPDLYSLCLNYPKSYAPKEVSDNLRKQGYKIGPLIGSGSLNETLVHVLKLSKHDAFKIEMFNILRGNLDYIAFYLEKRIIVHSTSMDNPITVHNSMVVDDPIVLYHNEKTGEYRPVTVCEGGCGVRNIARPKRKKFNLSVRADKNVKVLWKIQDDAKIDLDTMVCQVYIKSTITKDDWYTRLENLISFIDTNKRCPKSIKKDKKEIQYAKWLMNQRSNYQKRLGYMSDADKRKRFEEFLETYKAYFLTSSEKWYRTLQQLQDFIDTHGKRPSQHTKEKKERQLSLWINTQNHNYSQNVQALSDQQKRKAWGKFLDDYKEYVYDPNVEWDNKWNDMLNNVIKFIRENKKRPSSYKNKKTPARNQGDDHERKLASWIIMQQMRIKTGKITTAQKKKWDAFIKVYGSYIINKGDKWDITLNEVVKFMDMNKRRPSEYSKDANEKRIGILLGRKIYNYKRKIKSMADPVKYKKMTKVLTDYKSYLMGFDEAWNYMFQKVQDHVINNATRPLGRSKSQEEAKLGRWIATQQKNYKKNSFAMAKSGKRVQWSKFVRLYPDLFDTSYLDPEQQEAPSDDEELIETTKPTKSTKSTKPVKSTKLTVTPKKIQKSKPKKTITKQRKLTKRVGSKTVTRPSNNAIIIKPNDDDEVVKISTRSGTLALQSAQTEQPDLDALQNRYESMSSTALHKKFTSDPKLWHAYHDLVTQVEAELDDEAQARLPYNCVITYISNMKTGHTKYVADLGCGTAKVYGYFKDNELFDFYNYDHVAVDDSVTSCDISNVPLDDSMINIAILCLAMWGTDSNCSAYIDEAHRILDHNGTLLIIEPTKRWTNDDGSNRLEQLVTDKGFQIKKRHYASEDKNADKFVFLECIKQ